MIVGIGVDVVAVARWTRLAENVPGMVDRLLVPAEQKLADGTPRRPESLAARFAAKEALAKALGSPGGLAWHDAAVEVDRHGAPSFRVEGTVAERAESLGVKRIHLSMTHDGGHAIAYVVAEA